MSDKKVLFGCIEGTVVLKEDMEAFQKAMNEEVIPEIVKAIRRRQELAANCIIRNRPLY